MTFLSPTFMFIFLPIALGIYSLISKKRRNDFLPVIGIVFFVCVNITDLLALLYVSFIVASVAVFIGIYKKTHNKKFLRSAAYIFLALGFLVLTLRTITPSESFRGAGIIMCLMTSASLCFDLSNDEGRVPKTIWEGVTYVTYFPTMTAGPFVSYDNFLPRLDGQEKSSGSFSVGAMLFLSGFVKTLFIGTVFSDAFTSLLGMGAESMGIAVALLLASLQALALYAFFSGYSDIARGISYMLGIELDSDMGSALLNRTPSEYLRGFFKGFSVFFKKYIAHPIIVAMGENLISRIIASAVSSVFLLLLFCRSITAMLILLLPVSVAEYFVLFGRSHKRRQSLIKAIPLGILSFLAISVAWMAATMTSLDSAISFCHSILSNRVFYISYRSAAALTNPKYLVLPVVGLIITSLSNFVLANDSQKEDSTGFLVLKCTTAALLLAAFTLGIIMLLPQFPGLASNIFGSRFI